jgi:hypothetical protein
MLELLSVSVLGDLKPGGQREPDFSFQLAEDRLIALEETGAVDQERARAWGKKGTQRDLETSLLKAMAREGVTAKVSGYFHVEALIELGNDAKALKSITARTASLLRVAIHEGRQVSQSELIRNGIDQFQFLMTEPAPTPSVWLAVRALPQGAALVQRAIAKKTAKLTSYKEKEADEYWLLVVGGETISGFVTWGDVQGHVFTSPFDRTLFLDHKDNVCIELHTEP